MNATADRVFSVPLWLRLMRIEQIADRAAAAIFQDDEPEPDVVIAEVTQIHGAPMREIDRMGYRPAGAVGPGPWVFPGAGANGEPLNPPMIQLVRSGGRDGTGRDGEGWGGVGGAGGRVGVSLQGPM